MPPWYILAIDLTPLLVAAFLGWLMLKLRRRGHPNRAGEIVILSGAAIAAGNLAAHLALDNPPGWLPFVLVAVWVLPQYGYAIYRLRTNPPRAGGRRPNTAQQPDSPR